ncbi:MAG: hypothetical protein K2K74_04160, partial [Lachnospiraceae bacterium]|nr:hypothetical protein [Lachnospiraceae bacterium]
MYLKYGIIVLLIAFSFLSAVELDFAKEKKELFWKISFYFSAYLFLVSFIKYYLGYYKENLLESFWDIGLSTFVHYGVPLVIIAAAAPVILKLLFKEKITQIIRYFDSAMFLTLSLTFFFVRKINNKTYCIAFFAASLITIAALLLRKTKGVYVDRSEIKKKAIEAAP